MARFHRIHLLFQWAMEALFGFAGPADFVNGAIQLTNPDTTPILLDTAAWTMLFSICFDVDALVPDTSFCPSLVWDLEVDPADGGFLPADDGVVITVMFQVQLLIPDLPLKM